MTSSAQAESDEGRGGITGLSNSAGTGDLARAPNPTNAHVQEGLPLEKPRGVAFSFSDEKNGLRF